MRERDSSAFVAMWRGCSSSWHGSSADDFFFLCGTAYSTLFCFHIKKREQELICWEELDFLLVTVYWW